ncbi:MAG: response regulator [Acidobacteriota bacterium]
MLDIIPNKQTPKQKILLAEDDSSFRRFVEIILQRADYDVTAAEDGLIAMKIALEKEFDIIIADAIMPNLTGFDLCRVLRQNPNYQDKVFIILSGFDSQSETDLADAYLLKGNNLKEILLEKISSLVAAKQLVAS